MVKSPGAYQRPRHRRVRCGRPSNPPFLVLNCLANRPLPILPGPPGPLLTFLYGLIEKHDAAFFSSEGAVRVEDTITAARFSEPRATSSLRRRTLRMKAGRQPDFDPA